MEAERLKKKRHQAWLKYKAWGIPAYLNSPITDWVSLLDFKSFLSFLFCFVLICFCFFVCFCCCWWWFLFLFVLIFVSLLIESINTRNSATFGRFLCLFNKVATPAVET